MAGTITHLAVADLICERLGETFFYDISKFYMGNIAPDAIHARENYNREYKKRTHLTEGISGSEFGNTQKLAVFHKRLIEYINKNYRAESENADLYLGYIVHLVTDELYNINMRKRYVDLMEYQGVKDTEQEFFLSLMKDIDRTDRLLLKKYPFKHEIKVILESTHGYEIKNMITADESDRSRKWVIGTFFSDDGQSGDSSMYLEYGDILRFIELSVETILNRFTNDSNFPSIFVR